ncbi:SPW repeat protein [Microlunatus sp. GCM10028923]|uniref:SPW repeat protein n=1 Tax=Microlunatus sp. GCM10028923 TaxID=3273400 RepID=UPI0036156C57
MRKWNRWQDWAALVIGVYAFLSPIWTQTTTMATTAMIILGVLLAANALWSLAMPGAIASEYVHAGLGLLMFVSPWVLGFAGVTGMAWTAWILGVLALATGIWAIPYSTRAHHDRTVPQT